VRRVAVVRGAAGAAPVTHGPKRCTLALLGEKRTSPRTPRRRGDDARRVAEAAASAFVELP
jgi:hypothetical protein